MTAPPLPPLAPIRSLIRAALDEDMAWGDVTSTSTIPDGDSARASLVCKQDAVLAGGPLFAETFRLLDLTVDCELRLADASRLHRGDVVASLQGPTRSLLAAERVALNLLQRLSGVATLTAHYVDAVAGLPVRIVDTRKTTPGLRALEKYAVRCGGGGNHRFGLADAVLMKDNHLAALANRGLDLAGAIRAVRQQIPHTMRIEVEVTRLDQIEPVIAGGADIILLDNMDPATLRQGVERVAGRALTESSGGVTLDSVRARAETGVDIISIGALTHSAPAIDFSLELLSEH